MAANLGSAEFILRADAAELIRAMDQSAAKVRAATAQIAQDLNVSERAVTATAAKIAAAQDKVAKANAASAASFTNFARGAAGFTAAAAGITVGAATIAAALTKVGEETQKTAQLQFQLTRTYGESAASMTKFANELAVATGKSNLSVQEGIARFGVLERGYGLTRQQTEALAKATLDLAAATGTDTVEAFERMIGVFRDGGESVEKLGLVLNDQSVKAFANLTAEQKRNFDQMDALTKSQIRYTEAIKQAPRRRARRPTGRRIRPVHGTASRRPTTTSPHPSARRSRPVGAAG
jgi:hypothetical protein